MAEIPEKISPDRPEPVSPGGELIPVTKRSNLQEAARALQNGEFRVIGDVFPTGLKVLHALRKLISEIFTDETYSESRNTRAIYREASNRLLVPVSKGKLSLKKAPEIGWLSRLYPEDEDFLLPYPQIQGLNSAWQWYIKGLKLPVLDHKIYPFYGVYFPTRFDHLIQFDAWLKKLPGPKHHALDMGTGCGVLSFQMIKHGFEKVQACDVNPNAVLSVQENSVKFGYDKKLDVYLSDLFSNCEGTFDLIVFNPPWMPAVDEFTGLNQAIYYQPELFERFFESAQKHLNSDGKIVILFSNLAQKSGVTGAHPVEAELENNDRYEKMQLDKKAVKAPKSRSKRRNNRVNEFVELWVLQKK